MMMMLDYKEGERGGVKNLGKGDYVISECSELCNP